MTTTTALAEAGDSGLAVSERRCKQRRDTEASRRRLSLLLCTSPSYLPPYLPIYLPCLLIPRLAAYPSPCLLTPLPTSLPLYLGTSLPTSAFPSRLCNSAGGRNRSRRSRGRSWADCTAAVRVGSRCVLLSSFLFSFRLLSRVTLLPFSTANSPGQRYELLNKRRRRPAFSPFAD